MVKKTTKTKTKTVYVKAKKTKKRSSKLNRSVKKPMQTLGLVVGACLPYIPAGFNVIKDKSITPMVAAVTDKNNAVNAAKGAAVGFIGATVAALAIDKTGLKKPVNKVLKMVKLR